MKFEIPSERIPQDQRKIINDKILYLIETNTLQENGITAQDVFASFTGKGILHNLNFKDFDSFYDYTEKKKLIEVGQFFTPAKICKFIVDCVKPSDTDLIADLTYGMGNFFNHCPNEFNCYGTEIDVSAFKVARFLYPDAVLSNEDIRLYDPKKKFDIIFGNPPFNLRFSVGKDEYISQLYYFIKAAELLKPAGILAVIVPSSFLSDDFMDGKMIEQIDTDFNFIYQAAIPANTFKDVGVSKFATKIMFFSRKTENMAESKYSVGAEDITISDAISNKIYKNYLAPIQEEKKRIHAKLLLENISESQEDKDFQYRVKKYLWDIKNSKHTKKKYGKAFDYVNEFYTQKCPPEMDYDQWEKVRITKPKVLSYLKRILRDQHLVERDEIKLVKTNYGLKLKAYSRKSKLQLKKYGTVERSFNNLVTEGDYPFENRTYRNLVFRKRYRYASGLQKFKDIDTSWGKVRDIKDSLAKSYIMDYSKEEKIFLTDIQREDTAKMIFKGKGILDWEQGSGKSLAAISWYRHFKPSVRNVVILGPAIAVKLTWEVILTNYRESYIYIDSLAKINQIQPGQIVLISYDMLRKYERQMKRFMKIVSNKIALIVDESDEMTNHTSKRTQITRNCFRKAKYMLLTTGTTTRNNINELYSQLELLYNNSVGMICTCRDIYKFNPKEGGIEQVYNEYYGKPFPARHGNSLFKACFSPYKQTVFGIKKHNQDIYNSDHLTDIIERTIVTRSFFDITGKKPQFEIHRVEQNSGEERVYEKIVNEFGEMYKAYFRYSGNARKETMLRIIRQIQLLIKATSLPETFQEYKSLEIPSKEQKIFDLVREYKKEKVAIGTLFKSAAIKYHTKLTALHPDRKVFLVLGSVPFKERKTIIKEFEATKNGILVSTQQSLKSSVNIPTCDKVIIEALLWNLPRISQYYMRFVRFNSIIENKKIIFVVYQNSIEMNLLALLMDKQRINEFVKHRTILDRGSIFHEYGIDFGLIDMIMEKIHDNEEKKVKIAWGKQKIS